MTEATPHDDICRSWRSKGHADCICARPAEMKPHLKDDLGTVRKFIEGWKELFDQRFHSGDLGNKRYNLAALEDCQVALDAVNRIERIV